MGAANCYTMKKSHERTLTESPQKQTPPKFITNDTPDLSDWQDEIIYDNPSNMLAVNISQVKWKLLYFKRKEDDEILTDNLQVKPAEQHKGDFQQAVIENTKQVQEQPQQINPQSTRKHSLSHQIQRSSHHKITRIKRTCKRIDLSLDRPRGILKNSFQTSIEEIQHQSPNHSGTRKRVSFSLEHPSSNRQQQTQQTFKKTRFAKSATKKFR